MIPLRETDNLGARIGNRVSIRKLEKRLEDGTKVPTHPHYRWRASYVEGGRRKQKYFKTRNEADEWAENREKVALVHGTDVAISPAERAAIKDTRESLAEVGLTLREAVELAIEHQRKVLASCTVAEMIADALAARRRSRLSSRHIRDIAGKVGPFPKSVWKTIGRYHQPQGGRGLAAWIETRPGLG